MIAAHSYDGADDVAVEADSIRFTLPAGDVIDVRLDGDEVRVSNPGHAYTGGITVRPYASNVVGISAVPL